MINAKEWIAEIQPAIWSSWYRRAVDCGSTLVPALESGEAVVVSMPDGESMAPGSIEFDATIGMPHFERFERVRLNLLAAHGRRVIFQEWSL